MKELTQLKIIGRIDSSLYNGVAISVRSTHKEAVSLKVLKALYTTTRISIYMPVRVLTDKNTLSL